MDDTGAIIALQAGAYRLREKLAASAYGILWRADGPPSIGEAAIKLVNREQMERADESVRARWLDSANTEIAFLSSLAPWDQRHIVRLLDAGTHEGLPAMALELHDSDLARHLAAQRRRGQQPPFMRVLDWLDQANQALAKVHQHGFRYLDFKPGNLLLDAHSRLKLADFGTIRPLADRSPHCYTGTARWQAPEQFFPNPGGGYDTDACTDYFALGALFHYLVCGRALQFSRDCADAFAEAGSAGAAALLKPAGPRSPECLLPREASYFVHCVEELAPGAGALALALLRSLLWPQREGRPRHALEISRSLAAMRAAAGALNAMRCAA